MIRGGSTIIEKIQLGVQHGNRSLLIEKNIKFLYGCIRTWKKRREKTTLRCLTRERSARLATEGFSAHTVTFPYSLRKGEEDVARGAS